MQYLNTKKNEVHHFGTWCASCTKCAWCLSVDRLDAQDYSGHEKSSRWMTDGKGHTIAVQMIGISISMTKHVTNMCKKTL